MDKWEGGGRDLSSCSQASQVVRDVLEMWKCGYVLFQKQVRSTDWALSAAVMQFGFKKWGATVGLTVLPPAPA